MPISFSFRPIPLPGQVIPFRLEKLRRVHILQIRGVSQAAALLQFLQPNILVTNENADLYGTRQFDAVHIRRERPESVQGFPKQ